MAFHTFGPALVRDRMGPLTGRGVRVLSYDALDPVETFTTGADPQRSPVVTDADGFVPEFKVDAEHLLVWLDVDGRRKPMVAIEVLAEAKRDWDLAHELVTDAEQAATRATSSASAAASSASASASSAAASQAARTGSETARNASQTARDDAEQHLADLLANGIPTATTTENGLFSFTDKVKLDAASVGAIPLTMILRASSGRADIADPATDSNIANKRYVDGEIAGRAPITGVTYDPASATTPPSAYPMGTTTAAVVSSDGWPASATLLTVKRSGSRIMQWVTSTDADGTDPSLVWIRYGYSTGDLSIDVWGPFSRLLTENGDGGSITVEDVPNLPASKTTSGTFNHARLPIVTVSTPGAMSTADKAKLDAAIAGSQLSAGVRSQIMQGHGEILGDDGHTYSIVAGVIRPDVAGGNWYMLNNSTHPTIKVSSITTSDTGITLNYGGNGHQGVSSFMAVPDETMAERGVTAGCSVTNQDATIRLGGRVGYGGLVRWASGVGLYLTVNPTHVAPDNISVSWDTDTAIIEHPPLPISGIDGISPKVNGRGADIYQISTRAPFGRTGFGITRYNSSLTAQTGQSNMYAFWENYAHGRLNPLLFEGNHWTLGNIWYWGMFQIA